MAANKYNELVNVLITELVAGLGSYPNLLIVKMGSWDPAKVPLFERYCICVCPSTDPWNEVLTSVRSIQYIFSWDLFLLVQNYEDVLSVYGDTAPNLGVFQLASDVKDLLHASNLGGRIVKTNRELTGPLSLESAAAGGFDSNEHALARRVRMRYMVMPPDFCLPAMP